MFKKSEQTIFIERQTTTPKNKRNKYKKTINYWYLIELYIKIVILRIFFKYAKKFYEILG